MSWATIGRDQTEDIQANEKVRSEEAILHDLRSSYSQALQSLSRSTCAEDEACRAGVATLENIAVECSAALNTCSTSRAAIFEISYLANRNRIECISKQSSYSLPAAYELCLGTLQMMVELQKTDILLVLQTARYAREMKDMWTYKQLMLHYSAQLPYLYRDLVLDEFKASMQEEEALAIKREPALQLNRLMKSDYVEKDVSGWQLQGSSAQAFLRFVLDKIRTGRDESCTQLLLGWQDAWITPMQQESEAMAVDEAEAASPPGSTSPAVTAAEPVSEAQVEAQPVAAPPTEDVAVSTGTTLPVETAEVPGKAGTDGPESSGRRSKRARNPTLAAVEAIAASIPEGRRRGGAGAGGGEELPGAGAPAAVLQAVRASSADSGSDIFVALKKLFSEDAALFGDWRTGASASESAEIAQRQAAALRGAFPLPHAVTALSSGDSTERATGVLEKAGSPTRPVDLSSPLRFGGVAVDGVTYAQAAAPVFSAFCALLAAGDSELTLRMVFHAKVIETVAAPCHWPLLQGMAGLDEVVLRSWRRLTALHPSGAQGLLPRLTADEELLLLESALSYTAARDDRSAPVDPELWSTARELTVSILSSGHTQHGQIAPRASFWARFVDQAKQRARALWAGVVASRQIAVTDLPADSTREVLTTLVAELGDLTIVLPHVASHRWNRINRKGCEELLNALKHEGETADLIRRCTASSAWVAKALALVRTDGQLRTMLAEHSEGAPGQPSSSAANGRATQSACLPALLLQTCKKLDDPAVSLRTVTALLDEATQLQGSGVGFSDGADHQWLRDLCDHIVANWVAVPDAPTNDERSAVLEQLMQQVCALLLAFAPSAQAQSAPEAISLHCLELARLLCQSPPTRKLFRNTAVHAVLALGDSPAISADSPALLDLWSFLSEEIEIGNCDEMSDLSGDAWAQLVKLAVSAWQSLEALPSVREIPGKLFAVVLKLGANAGSHLSRRALGELLLVLHRALRQQAERAAHRPAGTKAGKRSAHSQSGNASSVLLREKHQRAELTKRLMLALEGLVMHGNFPTEFPQREQRPLVVTLGQLYHASYGYLLFCGEEGSDDEDATTSEFTAPVLLQLYAFTQLCIERGWASKAEIRAGMLQLSRAPVLRACVCRYGRPLTTAALFGSTDGLAMLRDSDQFARAAHANSDCAGLLTIASEIFHELLALGVTAADLESQDESDDTVAADSAGAYAAGLLMTTLRKECDLGECFTDPRAGFVVDCCLRDLCVNPLRWSSWQQLLSQVMESFNALCDELQKEVILTALPVPCFEFCSNMHGVLLPSIETENTLQHVCAWTSTALITRTAGAEFVENIISSLESAVGCSIDEVFASALARETISTRQGNAVSDGSYAVHMRRLAVLLALRNATLALVLRMNDLMQRAREAAVMAPAEEDEDESQLSAEQLSLVLSNAAKALPRSSPLRVPLQEQIAHCLARDWYFGDDLYALSTASRVVWSRAVAPLANTPLEFAGASEASGITGVLSRACTAGSEALALCLRAATALRTEIAARGALSKPTRIVITYHISTVCLKASLLLLRRFPTSTLLPAAQVLLSQVLECLGLLLKGHRRLASLVESNDCYDAEQGEGSDLSDPERIALSKIWCAVSVGVHGLKECRRLDAFDFRSVYRLSSTISTLGVLVKARPVLAPPQCVLEDLRGLGVSQLDDACALRELAKLFDRKRPQIVAMWCVESAATAFEKKLVRISQFDLLRKKYIDKYLDLAARCGETEVVLDVLAFALAAAKHATAVVVHVLHAGIATLREVVRTVLQLPDEDEIVEQAASKRSALISGATRVLQMAYELHCQLQGKLSQDAHGALLDVIAMLYVHSALYTPTTATPPSSDPVSADATAATSELADFSVMDIVREYELAASKTAAADAQGPVLASPVPLPDTTPDPTAALAACALKWAAYAKQLPRTEIGRRAKGYFLLLAAPERAQSSSSGGLANLAVNADATDGDAASLMTALEPEAAAAETVREHACDDVVEVILQETAPRSEHETGEGGEEEGPAPKAPRLEEI